MGVGVSELQDLCPAFELIVSNFAPEGTGECTLLNAIHGKPGDKGNN